MAAPYLPPSGAEIALMLLGIVALGLMVSFVIARYDFKLKGAMYSLFAAGLMFPLVVAITPLYIVIKDLGLIDSLAGVIIPQIAFGLPTTVIILVPFPVESALSGVMRRVDPGEALWYRRTFTVPGDWSDRLLLHFGAIDWEAKVYTVS